MLGLRRTAGVDAGRAGEELENSDWGKRLVSQCQFKRDQSADRDERQTNPYLW